MLDDQTRGDDSETDANTRSGSDESTAERDTDRLGLSVPSELDDFYVPATCRRCIDTRCIVPSVRSIVAEAAMLRELCGLPCPIESDADLGVVGLSRTLADERIAALDQESDAMPRICISEDLDPCGDGGHVNTEYFTAWMAERIDDEVGAVLRSAQNMECGLDADAARQWVDELGWGLPVYISSVARRNGREVLPIDQLALAVDDLLARVTRPSLEQWVRLIQDVVRPLSGAMTCVNASR